MGPSSRGATPTGRWPGSLPPPARNPDSLSLLKQILMTTQLAAGPALASPDRDLTETSGVGSQDDTELELAAPPASETPTPVSGDPTPSADAARQDVLNRIRSSRALPPGLQSRLGELAAACTQI